MSYSRQAHNIGKDDSNTESNLSILLYKLRNTRGVRYKVVHHVMTSCDHMLPQRRKRVYIIGTKVSAGTYSADMETLISSNNMMIKLLQSKAALPSETMLEAAGSIHIENEYKRRLDERNKRNKDDDEVRD
jgi:site-specific DNA-cytosine methylase